LRGTDAQKIWHFGREQGFAIVSKDTDFRERSFVEGFPPKIIWLDVGNAGTPVIVDLLQRERRRVEAFVIQGVRSLEFIRMKSTSVRAEGFKGSDPLNSETSMCRVPR